MDPCLDRPRPDCDRYSAAGPYTMAIEMFRDQLAAVGIEPGSTAVVVAGTESATCVV